MSMIDFLMWAGGIIVTGLFSLIGWTITMIFAKIDKSTERHDDLADRFDAHRLYAAETFTTKSDIKSMRDEIVGQLDRLSDKIDRINK